jgi:hypothetical protein
MQRGDGFVKVVAGGEVFLLQLLDLGKLIFELLTEVIKATYHLGIEFYYVGGRFVC